MVVTGISVEKEYEKQNVKQEDIQMLMEWVMQQAHLPHNRINELDAILAHHSCECDLEDTKKVIDLNYTLRTHLPFYQNREIDQRLEVALHTWLITPLPTLTMKGYTPIYCQILDADPHKFVYGDVVRAFIMILDLWQYEQQAKHGKYTPSYGPQGTVPGVALIVNLDRVSLGHISRINLSVAQQFFYFLQEAMFVRLKEFHFINAPSFIDKLLSMVKPFMKEELLDILKVHKVDSSTLDDYISKQALPRDEGGDGKDGITLRDETWRKIKANKTFYEEESEKRVDESKRLGGPKTLSSFFPGLEGSFKNLAID